MTKREFSLVSITALLMCIPLAIVAHRNYQATSLPSTVFDWAAIEVIATKNGERRNFFDTPTQTLKNLECHVTTLNANELSHQAHQHPDEELIIVKEGTVEVLVNGEMKKVGPGSIVFQASNTLHSLKNAGTTRASYYVIRWISSDTPKK
jgi:XRE family transcriptional regulator, regulator of sulfur utilization